MNLNKELKHEDQRGNDNNIGKVFVFQEIEANVTHDPPQLLITSSLKNKLDSNFKIETLYFVKLF